MPTTAEALATGKNCYQAGDFRQTESICRRILEDAPSDVKALCLLGAAYQSQGKFDEAIETYQQVLRLKPVEQVLVDVAPGELIDKITILEIKNERITDAAKLRNVRAELAALVEVRDRAIVASNEIHQLTAELKEINEWLWQVEDEIRECERKQEFGTWFIELARSVYRSNDKRTALKRRINDLLGAQLIEEKSYAAY